MRVIWYQDCSGSMERESEISGTYAYLLNQLLGFDILFQNFANDLIGDSVPFSRFSFESSGYGGTNYDVVFNHARNLKPDIIVIATDGWGNVPEVKDDFKVVWFIPNGDAPDHVTKLQDLLSHEITHSCVRELRSKSTFINYKDETDIKIGDVVLIRHDAVDPRNWSNAAFMTSIVFDIDEEHNLVWLARPHARAKKIGICKGDFSLMTERHAVEKSVIVRSYVCYTSGHGKKDNRGEVI